MKAIGGNKKVGSLKRLLVISIVVAFLSAGGFAPATALSNTASAPAQGGWQVFPSSAGSSMYTVDMANATDGWLGGTGGLLMHYDGAAWTEQPSPRSDPIVGLDMINSGTGFGITFQGRAIQYNGSHWVESADLTEGKGSLTGISMTDANNGWAVGYLGGIYRFQGGTWHHFQTVSYLLQAIDMLALNDGWIVGRTGLTMHWNGSFWQVVGTPQNVWFMSVDMVTSSDGWAVGDSGAIYHYNGAAWTAVSSPTDQMLHSVHMLNSSDGWAVGAAGTILHYDGQSWQSVQSPVTKDLWAVRMVAPDDGWAVGKDGTILHYLGVPDLTESAKSASTLHASAGEPVTYTITVRNSGSALAPSVIVTDTTPANATYVADSATTSHGTISGVDPLVVNVGDLAAGEEATISLAVTVGDPGPACWFLKNEALIASPAMSLTRTKVTPVGSCHTVYLPLVLHGNR
jgi:uncharacterized repeat protein (TIGR01451 family)